MSHILVDLMQQLTSINEEEATAIAASFPIKTFPKGQILLREGQIAQEAYYVIEGCIRAYTLLDGEEKTTTFFTRQQSAINFSSIVGRKPSKHYFECAIPTTVAVLSSKKENALYKRFPRFESFCRSGMEQMMGNQQDQLAAIITQKPAQRYRQLQAERPELLTYIPQYQIASYLGIQPETLSRIRKKLSTGTKN